MKTIKNLCLVALVTLFAFNCKNKAEVKTVEVETASNSQELDTNTTYAKAEFTVDGMMCAIGCAKTIESKLAKMDGVKSAKVDFDKKLAMVEYNEDKVTPENLTATVVNVADTYKVSNMKTVDTFSTGKTCDANCTKACCTNKTAEEKAACGTDCKKACCAEKA